MSRVQLALRVGDLEASIDFYRKLFDTEPAKLRPGYASFAIAEPPLKLVLLEGRPGQDTALDHLGVEVETTEQVDAASTRLIGEGLTTLAESGTTCCYALQDKVWVHVPARNRGRSTPSRATRKTSARSPSRRRKGAPDLVCSAC